MTIRIVVLTVFTALFAAAWSSDNDSNTASNHRAADSEKRLPKLDAPKSVAPEEPNNLAVNGPILRVPENVVASPVKVAPVTSPVIRTVSQSDWVAPKSTTSEQPPMPPGIASGHYYVVTNDGVKTELTVPGNKATSVRDIYIYRTSERRWYYIRQESMSAAPTDEPKISGPSVAINPQEAEMIELAEQEAKRRLQVITRWMMGETPSEVAQPATRTAEAPATAERQ